MLYLISTYWPHILFVVSFAMGAVAAIHATMTKEEVRAAIGWVGVIVLSPIIGAVLYAIAGINRMRRASLSLRRDALISEADLDELETFDANAELVISRLRPTLRGPADARRPGGPQSTCHRQYDRHDRDGRRLLRRDEDGD